ncbi:uncharacterized protein LOC134256677 [Saccostrea cucullata]|uniref:uncharacterized protein LOC134256677 n=1 Tax=Saccostrea cuccullata TaxID=36930 RepID=UPI002ED5FF3F
MSTESSSTSTSNRDVPRELRTETNSNSGQDFDVIDAVSLFNSRLDTALEKQKTLILSEIQDKLKPTNTFEFRGEGNKIQFQFNEERLRGLELLSQKLISGDFSGVTDLISSEKEAIRQRNKILRIADKHGWDTVKEYVDSDIADNSEDAARLRSAISRAANKKRKSPYDRPVFPKTSGVFDGLSSRQLFLGSAKFNYRQQFNPRFIAPSSANYRNPLQTQVANIVCHYCRLPGHFARFCPYTQQLQCSTPQGTQTTALVPTSTANQQ